MTSPNLDPQVRLLAGQLAQLQKRIFQLERNQRASAGPASIAAGGLTVTDPGGVPQVIVGQQSDGSYGVQSVTPQVPVAPDQPLAGPGILGIWVYWDGQMSDGSNPLLDLNSIQVHCSALSGFTPSTATLQGVLTGPGLFGVGNLTADTTYYACLVAVNQAGNTSPPSDYAQATAGSVPANIPPASLSGLQMQTGTLTAAQLAEEAGILGSQIANETLTDDNMQAGTLTARSIASNTITVDLLIANLVYAGIVNGTLIEGAQFIGDGTGNEWLVYDGTPAANNLLLSQSSVAMADDYGNLVLQGFTVYSTSSPWNAFNLSPGTGTQLRFYESTSQTAGWGTPVTLGVSAGAFTAPALDVSGGVSLNTGGNTCSLTGATGRLVPLNSLGQSMGTVALTQTDISSHSVGNSATATDITTTWTIAANDASFASGSGTVYELETCVDYVTGATSLETLAVSIDLDGTVTNLAQLGSTFNNAVGGGGLGLTYRIPVRLTVVLVSASVAHATLQGTIGADLGSQNALSPASANLSGHQAGLSFVLSSSHTIALNVKFGGTGGTGQFAGTNYSILTRKGP